MGPACARLWVESSAPGKETNENTTIAQSPSDLAVPFLGMRPNEQRFRDSERLARLLGSHDVGQPDVGTIQVFTQGKCAGHKSKEALTLAIMWMALRPCGY